MEKWFHPYLRFLFRSVQWRGPDSSLYLTFDDGPHPSATPAVLDILERENIKATFFLVGTQVLKHPDIVLDILRGGHMIGNHTMTHKRVWLSGKNFIEKEIIDAQVAIEDVCGVRPTMFRPPFARFDPWSVKHIRTLGLRTVMYSTNSRDYNANPTPQVVQRVVSPSQHGDIIVFHDNDQTSRQITPYLAATIEQLRKKGFSFAPLS